MKTTTVPAQITSVEDVIVGSLSVTQILLLSGPLFFSIACYVGLPPFTHFVSYKALLTVVSLLVCFCLALRVKGQLLLHWLVLITRYNLRPRYYLHVKTTELFHSGKEHGRAVSPNSSTLDSQSRVRGFKLIESSVLQQLKENPTAHVSFRPNKRGGTDVLYSEVEH